MTTASIARQLNDKLQGANGPPVTMDITPVTGAAAEILDRVQGSGYRPGTANRWLFSMLKDELYQISRGITCVHHPFTAASKVHDITRAYIAELVKNDALHAVSENGKVDGTQEESTRLLRQIADLFKGAHEWRIRFLGQALESIYAGQPFTPRDQTTPEDLLRWACRMESLHYIDEQMAKGTWREDGGILLEFQLAQDIEAEEVYNIAKAVVEGSVAQEM